MSKSKLEYLWLDGYEPTANIRSKTRIEEDFSGKLEDCPTWSFDGSSTKQAEGGSSDCLLKPVAIYPDPARRNGYLVMTEVLNPDGTPHESNSRSTIDDEDDDFWFGFEQEYFFTNKDGTPLGWEDGTPRPQGDYYCGVGSNNVQGREISEAHLEACLDAGIELSGTNAEVALGQWEYQCFGKGVKAGDDLWISRYLLHKIAEDFGVCVNLHPKPKSGDWNGSGMHANFSNEEMRTNGSEDLFKSLCEKLGEVHEEGIASYGSDNDMRLTGLHETQNITEFSYGVSDRGASIRIPIFTLEHDWNGYLEDRRPNANADPYVIATVMIDTICSAASG